MIEHRSPEEDVSTVSAGSVVFAIELIIQAWHEFVDKVREIHQEEPDWATVPFNAIDELNLVSI